MSAPSPARTSTDVAMQTDTGSGNSGSSPAQGLGSPFQVAPTSSESSPAGLTKMVVAQQNSLALLTQQRDGLLDRLAARDDVECSLKSQIETLEKHINLLTETKDITSKYTKLLEAKVVTLEAQLQVTS
ncbi:hypothetical protein Rhopal_006014-T1 [Rhodotorula paludigena]|uniref:Uncharacterized protein n=1 Tax=Rhodotorula paludigena TaxID=86838 RepID=A0AAV5GSP6_9BASI|nr:hypothetical protein Rhopal_006014-T1 [Rhodotorula paludigena]